MCPSAKIQSIEPEAEGNDGEDGETECGALYLNALTGTASPYLYALKPGIEDKLKKGVGLRAH